MVRPCQRISTSMSAEQASSGAIRSSSTVSPFVSGETTLGAMHLACSGNQNFVIEVVIPSHDLLFRPISVHNQALLRDRSSRTGSFLGLFTTLFLGLRYHESASGIAKSDWRSRHSLDCTRGSIDATEIACSDVATAAGTPDISQRWRGGFPGSCRGDRLRDAKPRMYLSQ